MNLSAGFAARVCAALYAGGALVSTIVGLFAHPAGYDGTGFVAIGATSAVVALALRLSADRAPDWVLPLAAALGTVLIALDLYFSGTSGATPADDGEVFFVWVALFGGYFFARRQVVLQLLLIGAAYLTALALIAPASVVAARWIQTMGTLVMAAAVVQMLRGRLEELVSRLTLAARTDPLTGLLNRRGFEEFLDAEAERARRRGSPLSLLLGDIDHFKKANDLLGHAGGDAALKRIAGILEGCTRTGDAVARTGGEEFGIVVPDCDHRGAFQLAETLRSLVQSGFAEDKVSLTLSFGVVTFPAHASSPRALQIAADQALYAAKEMGRNLTVIFSDEVASIVTDEPREEASADVQLGTLTSLAEALDQRDMGTAAHCQTVGRYCALVAEEMGMSPAWCERLRIAGVLHDVGKIGLPDAILQKPGPLEPHEWEQVRKHPEIGAGILGGNPAFDDIRDWILDHHERPDGTGYPRGLKGPEIPLPAKILAVADAFEAMTADRPYREAMSFEVARAELLGRAGTRFDPGVVGALLRVAERERTHDAARADTVGA